MLRSLTLLLGLAALPVWAETTSPNEEVTRWFAHCAAFDSADETVSVLALFACIDQAMKMCGALEKTAPGSGCFDGLEASARAEAAALIPIVQAIEPVTAFDRAAIERALETLSAPLAPGDCPQGLAPVECAAFLALVDWYETRRVIFVRSH